MFLLFLTVVFINHLNDFVDLGPDPDPYSSKFVDPDKINPDPHHWIQCTWTHHELLDVGTKVLEDLHLPLRED